MEMENVLRRDMTVRWMESLLPLLEHVAIMLVYFRVAVLLPMSTFRKLRHPIARWMAASIGLFAGVVGIIPMAIAGASLRSGIERTFRAISTHCHTD
jgi:hypothetical protein